MLHNVLELGWQSISIVCGWFTAVCVMFSVHCVSWHFCRVLFMWHSVILALSLHP